MTDLIQQRTPHDCALACMAMLTGKTWEETNAIIGHLVEYEGERRGMKDKQEALELLGFSNDYENGENVGTYSAMRRPYCISPEFFRSITWGRRALLSVPSLNNPGGWHMIYWDGAKLFDPSTKKTYAEWSDLKPNEIVIFREALSSS